MSEHTCTRTATFNQSTCERSPARLKRRNTSFSLSSAFVLKIRKQHC